MKEEGRDGISWDPKQHGPLGHFPLPAKLPPGVGLQATSRLLSVKPPSSKLMPSTLLAPCPSANKSLDFLSLSLRWGR